jgi:MFS family permease
MKFYETLCPFHPHRLQEDPLTLLIPLFAAGTSLQLNPDPTQLPGAAVLKNLANGVGGWALIAAMLGVVVGAVMWAFGHYSQNYQQAYNGRRGVMVSALAAVLIGGAPQIVSFFLGKGSAI